MPRRVTRARTLPAVGLALAGILATAGIALAGTPMKGTRYSGDVQNTPSLTVSFRVSKTGEKIKGLRIKPTIPNACGYGGPLPSESSKPAPITNGRFVATVKLRTGAEAKVHGKFVRHHRERGTIESINPASPSCDGTFRYSTKPR
jgi:hypothetical protein